MESSRNIGGVSCELGDDGAQSGSACITCIVRDCFVLHHRQVLVEEAVLAAGGCVVRLAGLYHAQVGTRACPVHMHTAAYLTSAPAAT